MTNLSPLIKRQTKLAAYKHALQHDNPTNAHRLYMATLLAMTATNILMEKEQEKRRACQAHQ